MIRLGSRLLAVSFLMTSTAQAGGNLALGMRYGEARRVLLHQGYGATNFALVDELSAMISTEARDFDHYLRLPFRKLGFDEVGCTFVDDSLCYAVWRRGVDLLVVMTRNEFSAHSGPRVFGFYHVEMKQVPPAGLMPPEHIWAAEPAEMVPGSFQFDPEGAKEGCSRVGCDPAGRVRD